MIVSGRQVSIPVIPTVCTESRLNRLQRPRRQGCLTCGEWVCVWEVKRYWFALKRAAHTDRERYRKRKRWAGTCIQLFGNKRVRASFVSQTSTLYNDDHELYSFGWTVMRSTDNALLLVGVYMCQSLDSSIRRGMFAVYKCRVLSWRYLWKHSSFPWVKEKS